MAMKNNLSRLARSFNRSMVNARNAESPTERNLARARGVIVLGQVGILKWGFIVALILIVLMFLTATASGVGQVAKGLTTTLGECEQSVDKVGLLKELENGGQDIPQEQKDAYLKQAQLNACEKTGNGFTGEAYPPTAGRVTEWFNAFRDNPPRYHQGMDIASSCGTPIYAFAGGEVIRAVPGTEARSTPGNYAYPMGDIVIQHTDGFKTRYLHSNGASFKVKVGDIVSAGDELAGQWTNGPSTGCHLHIEAYLEGKATDMNDYLEACGFIYTKTSSFNEFPEAPVQCGGGGVAGDTAGDNIKGYAKNQIKTMFNLSGSRLDAEFQCLNNLWNRESNWRVNAQNNAFAPSRPHTPEYQAYGIPQGAPGSKMASAGADWKTNPATQIRWGLGYIKDRYGAPCGAWAHSEARNWY